MGHMETGASATRPLMNLYLKATFPLEDTIKKEILMQLHI